MLNIPPQVYATLQNVLVKQQSRTPLFEMAMGSVIAHHAGIPAMAIPNPVDFFIGAVTSNPVVAQFLGTLSDHMPIQAFAIKAHAEAFWRAKYDLVHGKAVPLNASTNGLVNITRMAAYFTPENIDVLTKNPTELNTLLFLGDTIYDFLRDSAKRNQSVTLAVA